MATARQKLEHSSPRFKLYRNDSVEFEDAPTIVPSHAPVKATLGDFIYPDVASRQACFWGGLVFGLIGAIESMYPNTASAVSNRYLGLFYLFSGAALVLPALTLPPKPLAKVGIFLGLSFGVLGFAGFLLGSPQEVLDFPPDRFHWALWPGNLEFSTKDHILQEIIGVTLVLVGLHRKRPEIDGLLGM